MRSWEAAMSTPLGVALATRQASPLLENTLFSPQTCRARVAARTAELGYQVTKGLRFKVYAIWGAHRWRPWGRRGRWRTP